MGSVNVSIYAEGETKDTETAATESINNIITEMDIPEATETPDETIVLDEANDTLTGEEDISQNTLEIAASGFIPRLSLSAADCNLKYWAHGSYGTSNGFSRNYNLAGGNCTWYAFGRAWELLGSLPRLCTNNAGAWYQYNKNNGYYPYGSTPKLGAIAVWDHWDNNTGHVAVVEEIGSNYVVFSESGWSFKNTYFDTPKRAIDSNGTPEYYSSYRFLGYIYILGDSVSSAPVHTHNWTGHYESAHPHKYYETCSCGQTAYPGGTQQVTSCQQCYPIGNASLDTFI